MTISYELYNGLYINLTNKCTNRCSFCIRHEPKGIAENLNLWLECDPSLEDILKDLEGRNLNKYDEIVFCGYGEPMIRLNELIETCKYVKKNYRGSIRINTNGQANIIHGKDITPMLEGLVDSISISLNAKNAKQYNKLCLSKFGEDVYQEIIDFAVKCKKYIPEVIFTVVDVIPEEDIKECEKIARKNDIKFRVRKYTGH